MSSLTMSIHDLLKMIFDEFVIIEECFKVTVLNECDILTYNDIVDMPIEYNFKLLSKHLYIFPNGSDNCVIELRQCFLDSYTFNIVEKCESEKSNDNDPILEKSNKVKEPIKLTDEKYLRLLKKEFARNADEIINCYETIDNMRERNKELKKDIDELEKQLSNNNI